MDNTVILEAKDAGKQFFRKTRESAQYFDAVSHADLALASGKLVALRGRSGSGKSTLLNMLAGLLEPTTGVVELEGQNLYALPDADLSRLRNERIGVIPQGQTALHSLTVMENVTLPYLMYRTEGEIDARARQLLERLDIAALADAYPRELSGGELRRVAVARALICAPRVVLADEPTGDLDDENTQVVFSLLREVADRGAAVLVVTHEQVACEYADTMLTMSAGTLSR